MSTRDIIQAAAGAGGISGFEAYVWGYNVGDNTSITRSSPVQIGADADWAQLSGTNGSRLAIKTDGSLWAWGFNQYGQLGLNDIISRSSPVQVGANVDWAEVRACGIYTLARKTNGTLWAWGYNFEGQLGLGDRTDRSSPIQVGALSNWAQLPNAISTSVELSGAIKTDGTLWMWGRNNLGQLGLGNTVDRSSPVQLGAQTWSKLAINSDTVLAIRSNGTLYSWGDGFFGELGINVAGVSAVRSSPVQIGALTTWSEVFVTGGGSLNACFAIKGDGTLWSWGGNGTGVLGHNDRTNRSSPVQVGSLTDWSSGYGQGGTSFFSVAVLKTDKTLWWWGNPNNGESTPLNSNISRSSPVQVGALANWVSITGEAALAEAP
jgi:alpha-tubulin suppressor-like RCC1 family protein